MWPSRNYYLFISHAWTRNAEYVRLVNLLNAKPRFYWHNYSVPSAKPLHANSKRALQRELNDQIRPAQAVLIISGMYDKHRDWIQYEIDKALKWENPIIGIIPRGNERLPREVSDVAAKSSARIPTPSSKPYANTQTKGARYERRKRCPEQ